MNDLLTRCGYVHDPATQVWSRPGYGGIAYSDGDQTEERIASIISQSKDVSLFSHELIAQISDWPSSYHLSPSRANILRPFQQQMCGADILEIGAGCGAISRFLGESGANVLAVEGTLRRARTARMRTRDLPNVHVVADNFEEFDPGRNFDLITLIGVLEYANLFIKGARPELRMLERAAGMLKENGRIVIAIENQLGLKYLAGAPEDHIGQSVYGVEGRYQQNQPHTYGRKELLEIIREAGFAGIEVMAPFPDYKFPVSIITERGFSCEAFDTGAIAAGSVRTDPQLPPVLTFSLELTWPLITRNGMGLDLANSFLISATSSPDQIINSSVLAHHYCTSRTQKYCKEILFIEAADKSIQVQCSALKSTQQSPNEGIISLSLPETSDYVQGILLSKELTNIVVRDGWNIEEIGEFLRRYLKIVTAVGSAAGETFNVDRVESVLPGRYFDLTPQNIVIRANGEFQAFDQEWTLHDDISVGWLVYRALTLLLFSQFRFAKLASAFTRTRIGFLLAAYHATGFEIEADTVLSYANLEAATQSEIAQKPVDINQVLSPDASIGTRSLFEAYFEMKNKLRDSKDKLSAKSAELKVAKEHIRKLERSAVGKFAKFCRRLKGSARV